MPKILSVIVPSVDGTDHVSISDPRIEVVRIAGVTPVGRARAEGLARATGEYVAWIDADDEISDHWAERILEVSDRDPDVIAFGYEIDGRAFPPTGDLIEAILRGASRHMSLWGMAIRRDLWRDIEFDRTAEIMEDWGVLPSLLSRARSFVMIPDLLYRYQPTARGTSSKCGLAPEVDRRLTVFGEWFRHSAWSAKFRYRLAFLEGVARMRCWFRTPSWRRWLLTHLPMLMLTKAKFRQKLKWLVLAGGLG